MKRKICLGPWGSSESTKQSGCVNLSQHSVIELSPSKVLGKYWYLFFFNFLQKLELITLSELQCLLLWDSRQEPGFLPEDTMPL